SRFIAYSKMNEGLVYGIYIYSLESGRVHCVSQGIFNDFGPVFSADGEHLFFVSNRRFDPTFCDFEWEMVYKKVSGIYCLTLKKDGKPLFPFKSDEETAAKEGDGKKDGGKDDKKKSVHVKIDFEGVQERIEVLPLPRGNYRSLAVNESSIFYLNKDEGDFNRFEFRNIGSMNLYRFTFDDREEKTVIEGIDGYGLSADGSHIVYKKGSTIGIIEASAEASEGEAIDLSDLKMHLDPLAEWKQIFNETWRMERDFYYEPNMHGLDWAAMKEKYARMLPYVSCRQDIQYVIGELIGELSTSHTYVFGGDRRRTADRVNVGMLGVDWDVDKVRGRYRFGKIYRVSDWTREVLPPLVRPGVDVQDGDYLLQVNGEEVTADRNVYSYFVDLAGKQVTLVVGAKPIHKGAREITVEPLRGERTLHYLDWVERNRLMAERESGGQIGYIHLPDTYMGSAREFPKYFYVQTRKKGL
ncbi:MAG: PDZ domain-containing protein, partial [Candidatus Krumholzibacteria bacterium]|nr:PDZ domain-containing protein [Candidatus Krumholzibacteria bacterium]